MSAAVVDAVAAFVAVLLLLVVGHLALTPNCACLVRLDDFIERVVFRRRP